MARERDRAAREQWKAWQASVRGERHYDPQTGEVEPGAENQAYAEASWRKSKHKFEAHPTTGLCMRCSLGAMAGIHY